MYAGDRQSGLNQKIHQFILNADEQVQYVLGVLQGVVEVDPVCMEGVFARAEWDKHRLF